MVESVNDKIADALIDHEVKLLRFSEGEYRKVLPTLQQMEKELIAAVANTDPTEPKRSRYRQARLDSLLSQVREIMRDGYSKIWREQRADLGGLAVAEQAFITNTINSAITVNLFRPVITETALKVLADDLILTMNSSSASTVRDWWSQQAGGFERRYANSLKQGLFRDEGLSELIRRIRDLGVPTRRGAAGLVRTSILGMHNEIGWQNFQGNTDVIAGVAAITTLDTRTSAICISRTGSAWSLETGEPLPGSTRQEPFPGRPPWHFLCRSTLAPVTHSHAQLLRNTEDRTRYHNQLLNLDPEQKQALDSSIPISQNYADFLRKKTPADQRKVLGRKRLELWKSGKIGLSDLIDQAGRPLTVAELTR